MGQGPTEERTDHLGGAFPDDAPADPIALFEEWFTEARTRSEETGALPDPTALVLSTVELATGTEAGGEPQETAARAARPRSRTVLLKARDQRGFVVYTHLTSPKGRQIERTPWASMLFPWWALQRQVRVDGQIEQVDDAEADAYWRTRPRGSQLGAWASHQSRPVTDRAELETAYAEAEARFEGRDIPRPPHWSGLRLVPDRIEFWQGRAHRMHDRLLYEADDRDGWRRSLLQP